jgi:hypothetical protein
MSSDENLHHHHHHHKAHKVLEKISSKISAIKDDISEAVKERSHSTTSDHRNPISSDPSLSNADQVSLRNEISSASIETKPTIGSYGMLQFYTELKMKDVVLYEL